MPNKIWLVPLRGLPPVARFRLPQHSRRFFTRAYDFIRMAAISQSNIKLMGSHVGVSIGEDGPSQMGLEDLAIMAAQPGMVVLYPSDAMCAYRLVESMANHKGMAYMRTGRPKTPILYDSNETFTIGGCKVLAKK